MGKLSKYAANFRDQRDAALHGLRAQGLTYQAIGNIIGVSRQRIEQIIGKDAPAGSGRSYCHDGWITAQRAVALLGGTIALRVFFRRAARLGLTMSAEIEGAGNRRLFREDEVINNATVLTKPARSRGLRLPPYGDDRWITAPQAAHMLGIHHITFARYAAVLGIKRTKKDRWNWYWKPAIDEKADDFAEMREDAQKGWWDSRKRWWRRDGEASANK